jgi:hypothetical protein
MQTRNSIPLATPTSAAAKLLPVECRVMSGAREGHIPKTA